MRAGTIREIYTDGTCRVEAHNEKAVYFGELAVMGGGMVVFSAIDDRGMTVSPHSIHTEPTIDSPKADPERQKTRVRIGTAK